MSRACRELATQSVFIGIEHSFRLYCADPILELSYSALTMESIDFKKQRAQRIVRSLARSYPDARCRLTYHDAFELLIKTILSAQCTDERVNFVGETLFRKYRSPEDFIQVPQAELENDIRSIGFFRSKARHIQACCRTLIQNFNGCVPSTMDELVTLSGVGRKTANVILGNIYNIPSLAVDTHVIRISRLLKLTRHTEAESIEADLMKILSPKDWVMFSHRVQMHGRTVCIARRPQCDHCSLAKDCPSANK